MNPFELDYRKFELLPQIHQLSTSLSATIKEVFETLEMEGVDVTSSHSIIEPIVNRNFGNTFQYHNGPNKRQLTHKNTSQ